MIAAQNTIPMNSSLSQNHALLTEILINSGYTGPIIHKVIHRSYHDVDHGPVPSFTCPMHHPPGICPTVPSFGPIQCGANRSFTASSRDIVAIKLLPQETARYKKTGRCDAALLIRDKDKRRDLI
ncbi:hypothetical protein TH5_13370 [Thalassospira xianhensis MCCC 1A02616]|uniref:Uncharacterized protein n=1 Tax=Thalassospira xianhensis MCCC 1A02616 TaxID=1177929 RepID=A0A367UD54_9PROT|nr:hypothetical protein TH5_13370 [Thalassospira xianhensis MCCC 1A02616]